MTLCHEFLHHHLDLLHPDCRHPVLLVLLQSIVLLTPLPTDHHCNPLSRILHV
jgi:hypothetical protein